MVTPTSTQTPRVSIVIPVLNQQPYTAACLAALYRTVPAAATEILIVDNGSTDETASFLRAEAVSAPVPIRVISFPENRGFSVACNVGAAAAIGEYVVFLNNDTIPSPGWIEPLLRRLEDHSIGIVGPKLVYPDTLSINHAGYVFSSQLGRFYPIYHNLPHQLPAANTERDYQALLGACLAMRRDLFITLKGFADFGLEDIDLCLRTRVLGLSIRYAPESVVYHHGSVSFRFSTTPLPPVDHSAFNSRWNRNQIIDDDVRFYQQDNYEAHYEDDAVWLNEPESVALKAVHTAHKLAAVNQLGRAINHLRGGLVIAPRNLEAWLALIAFLTEAQRGYDAIEACRELISLRPEIPHGYLYLARLQGATGNIREASKALAQVAECQNVPPMLARQAAELGALLHP